MHGGARSLAAASSLFILGTLGAAPVAHAQAQDAAGAYPSRPIRIIVPFSAGAGSDFLARLIGPKMTERWGQLVVVDNRPSAAGTVAGEIVTRATPDGHTLMITSSGIAASAALYPKLPYDTVKDFASVTKLAITATLFVTAAQSSARTIKDLIEQAKKRPGQLTYGHSGIGSGTHFASELLNVSAGIKTVHVPYKGGAEVMTDAIAGRIDYGVVPMAPAVPLVKAGRAHGIAVTTAARSSALPDVPTVAESGLPGYVYDGWFGVFAPSKVPAAIVRKLSEEVARILALPDVRERLQSVGMEPTPGSPQALHSLLTSEIEARKKIFGTQAGKLQ
jgi:tripartite-type tricarboxylate transporter receptor subunit TctC